MNASRFAFSPRACLLAVLAFVVFPLARAEEKAAEPPPKSFAEALERAGVKLVKGPATYPLGDVAELKLPAGYSGVEKGSLKRYYELTQNMAGGNEAGVVLSPGEWTLYFAYESIGYVKDGDKDQLDADKLMKTMLEAQEEGNKARARQGWDELKYAGWAQTPRYDEKTNNLTWALRLTSSGDGHKEVFLNESIRLLGRGGVMNVTLVTGPATFTADHAAASELLTNQFSYVSGHRYAEFKEGDKVAEYGLAALVVGGAGAAAFKFGFLQKVWKLIVFGVLAAAGAAKKLWAKITGRDAGREVA